MSADHVGEALALIPPRAVNDNTVAVGKRPALHQHGEEGAVPLQVT